MVSKTGLRLLVACLLAVLTGLAAGLRSLRTLGTSTESLAFALRWRPFPLF